MKRCFRNLSVIFAALLLLSVSGTYAIWFYKLEPPTVMLPIRLTMKQPDVSEEINNAAEQFDQILNSEENLTTLLSNLNTLPDGGFLGGRDASYISNVEDADDADKQAIADLFGDNLKIEINGEEKEIKVMIKRDNVDGNENTGDTTMDTNKVDKGSELILFFTDQELSPRGASVTVYAIIFTKQENATEWAQIGLIFTGTATVKRYNGWPGTGSFDTTTWRSSIAYNGNAAGSELSEIITSIVNN